MESPPPKNITAALTAELYVWPSEPQTGASGAAWQGLQPPRCLILQRQRALRKPPGGLPRPPQKKITPPSPSPAPYLCSSFLRLMHMARW